MDQEFVPTHTLTITTGAETTVYAVACVDEDWEPREPGPGAALVTREEWESACAASYALDADGVLRCNGSRVVGSWEIEAITSAGLAGEAEGHADRLLHDEDGIEIPAPYRAPRAWARADLAADYARHYNAARSE